MIIEMRDGVLKEFTLGEFLRFMLFMPTFTSGPIDRFKRFNEDYQRFQNSFKSREMKGLSKLIGLFIPIRFDAAKANIE